MKPKFNKLITLLLLASTFAFLLEAEEKVTAIAKKELSGWASMLPDSTPIKEKSATLNPYAKPVNLLDLATSFLKKGKISATKPAEISISPLK